MQDHDVSGAGWQTVNRDQVDHHLDACAAVWTFPQRPPEDFRPTGAGWKPRLHEKGGKQHVMPCHRSLAEVLRAYIDAAGVAEDRKDYLFRTSRGYRGVGLSEQP
jgi:integrase